MSPREERGQTAAEYLGLLLVVAVVVGVLAGPAIPGALSRGIQGAICSVSGGGSCGGGGEGGGGDARAAAPPDRDADGVPDARERRLGTDPDRADSDGDGIDDGAERAAGADPTKADTDDDGIPDADEIRSGGRMKPGDADSDDDGLSDAEEVAAETDPSEADGDGEHGVRSDGLTDREEIERGTDPNAYDTDGDGHGDGYEVDHGTDPLEDERSLLEKGFETLVLDDPISAILPGGGAGKGAKKVIDDLLGAGGRQGVKQIGGEAVEEAGKLRKGRIRQVRERLRQRRTDRAVGDLPLDDAGRAEVHRTLDRIERGGPHPFPKRDGTTFKNVEGRLPEREPGYYREYTVPTPGSANRAKRRIVVGAGGERYYSGDHYETFVPIPR